MAFVEQSKKIPFEIQASDKPTAVLHLFLMTPKPKNVFRLLDVGLKMSGDRDNWFPTLKLDLVKSGFSSSVLLIWGGNLF